jgi:predicted nucleic acid-binding Zn ribbon protein
MGIRFFLADCDEVGIEQRLSRTVSLCKSVADLQLQRAAGSELISDRDWSDNAQVHCSVLAWRPFLQPQGCAPCLPTAVACAL